MRPCSMCFGPSKVPDRRNWMQNSTARFLPAQGPSKWMEAALALHLCICTMTTICIIASTVVFLARLNFKVCLHAAPKCPRGCNSVQTYLRVSHPWMQWNLLLSKHRGEGGHVFLPPTQLYSSLQLHWDSMSNKQTMSWNITSAKESSLKTATIFIRDALNCAKCQIKFFD